MPKIRNTSKKAVANRNRVRFHRKVKSILENQRKMFEVFMNAKEQNTDDVRNDHIDSNQRTLRNWAIQYRIKRGALSDLLKILKSLGIDWLPIDSRTFLKTPNRVGINNVAGGKMWYRGIAENIMNVFAGLKSDIVVSLNFNVDGMALFKSSKKQIWPILVSIHGKFE